MPPAKRLNERLRGAPPESLEIQLTRLAGLRIATKARRAVIEEQLVARGRIDGDTRSLLAEVDAVEDRLAQLQSKGERLLADDPAADARGALWVAGIAAAAALVLAAILAWVGVLLLGTEERTTGWWVLAISGGFVAYAGVAVWYTRRRARTQTARSARRHIR